MIIRPQRYKKKMTYANFFVIFFFFAPKNVLSAKFDGFFRLVLCAVYEPTTSQLRERYETILDNTRGFHETDTRFLREGVPRMALRVKRPNCPHSEDQRKHRTNNQSFSLSPFNLQSSIFNFQFSIKPQVRLQSLNILIT